jgi:hypothetical protein
MPENFYPPEAQTPAEAAPPPPVAGPTRNATAGAVIAALILFLRRNLAAMRAFCWPEPESVEGLAARIDAILDQADVETDRLLDLAARNRAELQAQIDFLLRQAREADATIEARSTLAAHQDRLREVVRQVRGTKQVENLGG